MARRIETKLPPPWLKRVWIDDEKVTDRKGYPFHIPLFRSPGFELEFNSSLTIIVGDNGAGKSTLIEAIADVAGFGLLGGGRHHRVFRDGNDYEEDEGPPYQLGSFLRASWLPKIGTGWFFRAESFYGFASYLDDAAAGVGASRTGYLDQSHGEGFMNYFEERSEDKGLFIFDEPEAALSPNRQFEFIRLIMDRMASNRIQAIIATHSPILMAIPGARLLQIDRSGLNEVSFRDTAHFRLYSEFLRDPEGTIEAMTDS